MAKINQALLSGLCTRLGVSNKRVYALIKQIAHREHVESHLASLILARDSNMNYQRYATSNDLAELRALGRNGAINSSSPSPSLAAPVPANRSRAMPIIAPKPVKTTRNNSVFVVHGRDDKLRKSMFDLLLRFGLNPMEWSQAIANARGANPNVGETINAAMKKVQGVIVMFSPDEQAKLKSKFCSAKEKRSLGKLDGQARPNVLFEAGLALGAHPEKTLLVQIGDMRDISDIAGKHMLRLNNSTASRNELANRLRKLKFKIDTSGQDWTTVGDFDR